MSISRAPLFLLSVCSAAAILYPARVRAQADPASVAAIVEEGKNHSQIMKEMTYIAKKIGPRLTASPQLDKAYAWTQKMFKSFGCKNVHLEEWAQWPVGFERGKNNIGRMVSPEVREFEFTTPSWTPGTNGRQKALAVLEPTTMEEYEKVKDQLKGAWLIGTGARRRPTGEPTELQKALESAGTLGRVYGSSNELVITFGQWNLKVDDLPKLTQIIIRKSDMDAVKKNIADGKKVELEFDLPQKFVPGPRHNYNVVAEIPGTEKPDEVVIISGHLDSWDGPMSEGAQDNGTGSGITLEAARILTSCKVKPKRTIRFILWTGEEQGLFGSAFYVKAHKDEMDKISCVFVDDGGTNYEGGLSCTEEMKPILEAALKPAMDAFPNLPMKINTVARIPRGGGSDHASFNAVNVPGFYWFETGKADYNFVHHTQHDRLDLVIPEYMIQSCTNSAAAAYIVACAPTMLPRDTPKTSN